MEAKIRKLAEQVLSGEALSTFLALPLRSQVVGLGVLAHIGGDADTREACLTILAREGRETCGQSIE